MQNKKLYIVFAIAIVVIAAAAFVGGRLLTGQAGPLRAFQAGNGDFVSVQIRRTPAPELPATQPEMTGLFVSRDDNVLTLQSMGSGGIRVVREDDAVDISPADGSDAPTVEVVITGDTQVWHDTTQIDGPPTSGEVGVQQTVEVGSLDDLTTDSMIMVWGRKNGDRIIADVIAYSNPMIFSRP